EPDAFDFVVGLERQRRLLARRHLGIDRDLRRIGASNGANRQSERQPQHSHLSIISRLTTARTLALRRFDTRKSRTFNSRSIERGGNRSANPYQDGEADNGESAENEPRVSRCGDIDPATLVACGRPDGRRKRRSNSACRRVASGPFGGALFAAAS